MAETKRMQHANDKLGYSVRLFIEGRRAKGDSWESIKYLLKTKGINVGTTALRNSWSVRG